MRAVWFPALAAKTDVTPQTKLSRWTSELKSSTNDTIEDTGHCIIVAIWSAKLIISLTLCSIKFDVNSKFGASVINLDVEAADDPTIIQLDVKLLVAL